MPWHSNEGQEPSPDGRTPGAHRRRAKNTSTAPGYSFDQPAGFFLPLGPLPVREAIQQLPQQYRLVILHPWPETFSAAAAQASWSMVWIQLYAYATIAALLGFLGALLSPAQVNTVGNIPGASGSTLIRALTASTSLGLLILIPVLFFAAMSILFLLAKAFGGQGSFLQQSYTTLLFLAPFGTVVSILGIIPFAGSFLAALSGLLLFLYGLLIQTLAAMGVHQLSGGKATVAVALTTIIVLPLAAALFFAWTAIFSAL